MWALISAPACGLTIAMLEGERANPTAATVPAASAPERPRIGCAVTGDAMFAPANVPDFWTSGLPTIALLESAYGWTVCSVLNSVRSTEASSGRTVVLEFSNWTA